jgi:hypothetical protein
MEGGRPRPQQCGQANRLRTNESVWLLNVAAAGDDRAPGNKIQTAEDVNQMDKPEIFHPHLRNPRFNFFVRRSKIFQN